MLTIALSVRFSLELCLLAIGAWYAFLIHPGIEGVLLGAATVSLLSLIWGLFLAPRRKIEIGQSSRLVLELSFFGTAAAALYTHGHSLLAAILLTAECLDKWAVTVLNGE